jgi:hypothetical protein
LTLLPIVDVNERVLLEKFVLAEYWRYSREDMI